MPNKYVGLDDVNGSWCTNKYDLEQISLSYFKCLFTSENVTNYDSALECVQPKVTNKHNQMLI